MKARIFINLKFGVLDPQGKAIETALAHLGHDDVEEVRQGKLIELSLSETDRKTAHEKITAMCEQLLANTVIENYEIELIE